MRQPEPLRELMHVRWRPAGSPGPGVPAIVERVNLPFSVTIYCHGRSYVVAPWELEREEPRAGPAAHADDPPQIDVQSLHDAPPEQAA